MLGCVGQRLGDQRGVPLSFTGSVVRPGPEETAEAVTFGAWHDVHVQVRDGLTDHVVDCHERSLRTERVTDGDGDALGHGQQRNHQIARQAQQRVDMSSRSDENMTLEHRPVIKKGDHLVIPCHDRSLEFAAHNLADDIAHRHEISAT